MLVIPEEIKELFLKDNVDNGTAKKIRLIFYDNKIDTLYPYDTLFPENGLFPCDSGEPWLVIENNRIDTETLSITEALSESENMEFGSCETSMLEIVVADVVEDLTGREFTITVEIGGYEMSMGVYTVKSFVRQADRRKRKITAFDRMDWFNVDVSNWYNDLVFPMTLRNFRDSLCGYIGVQQIDDGLLFDSMQIEKTIEPTQLSGLDVLRSICQINGCFGHIDKTGQLKYIHLQLTGLYPADDIYPENDLYPSDYGGDGNPVELITKYHQGMSYEDYLVEGITGIIIREQEGDVGANAGEGSNAYVIEGNFLVYGKSSVELLNIAQSLLPRISGRIYRPLNIECNARPWVEVGDAIRVPTRDEIIETFVMKRVITGCQAMVDSYQATGNPSNEEVFGIGKQIIQLEGKSAVIIKNVEEVSVRLTNLKEQEETHFKITSDAITAEAKRATEAEASLKVQADNITLDVRNFKTDVNSRFEVTDKAINAKVSKGDVSSQLSIEPDKVTLKSNRLIVDSSNFKLDGNGNATFSGRITGGSININNVFTVDASGNTKITGNHFSWSATNSSMGTDGTLTCKNANITGSVTASTGKIGGFEINGDSLVAKSRNTRIQWGDFSIDYGDASLGEIYAENFIEVGALPSTSHANDGDIYAENDIYAGNNGYFHGKDVRIDDDIWIDHPFYYGRDGRFWSVTESIEDIYNDLHELMEYVYKGGWNPGCPNHGGGEGCPQEYGCDGCDEGDCPNETLADDIGGCGGGGTGCGCDGHVSCGCDDHTSCTCDDYGSSCGCDSQACGPGDG